MFGYVAPPFGDLWPQIVALLDKAVRKGGNDWVEVGEWLGNGQAQLWLTVETETIGNHRKPVAAMVTTIDGDTLEIWLAGGAVLSGSVPSLETVIEASKAAGTTRGRIVGRKGWERVLKPYGWRRDGDELVREWADGK